MTEPSEKALLPAGLQDLLPPDASHEAGTVGRLLAVFRAWGYGHVKPPMLEFEEALLTGPGAALASQTFRLMDPVSQRMMGLRADMTPQVARMAGSRLAKAPRPLRLSYAGQVLQVRGSQLRPERQFGQVGAELLGASEAHADAEVILLGAEALLAAGVTALSVDVNMPPLVASLMAEMDFEAEKRAELMAALDGKDVAAVENLAGEGASLLIALLDAAGPADRALEKLGGLKFSDRARLDVERLREVVEIVRKALPDLALTIDPAEHRGFEYQTGISFIFLARGVRGELGRGGRYATTDGESSTGFSLFTDTVMRAVPGPAPEKRLLLPVNCNRTRAKALQEEGWITLSALSDVEDMAAEATRLGCTHWLLDEEIKAL